MTDPNSEEEKERVRKFLEKTPLGQKVKRYSEQWDREEKAREKELREHPRKEEEHSIFDEPEPKERGLLTHPKSEYDKDPDFPSLTMAQRKRIEGYLREGLSIRSTKKAIHVDNFDVSYGTLQAVRKKMKEVEVHQSSSSSSSSS